MSKVGFTESPDYMCFEDISQANKLSRLQPVVLDYCGKERCEPGSSFGPFIRVNFVAHIVTEGKGFLKKDEKKYPVEKGQVFLIYPGEETFYQADTEDPWHYMWIGFHGYQAEEMLSYGGFSRENPVITCSNLTEIRSDMEALLSIRELSFKNELKRTSILYHLMAMFVENCPADHTAGKHETTDAQYVRAALNLMMDSFDQKIRVSDIARSIGISRNYLTTIFKNEMKVSPQEFLINLRMERSVALLTSTSNPVNLIADWVGYNDALSFSKAFRRRYGMSPTEFRERKPSVITKNKKGEYESNLPL